MTSQLLIYNAKIINENREFKGAVFVENGFIKDVIEGELNPEIYPDAELYDASGLLLLPGVIDDQVHFRDPGLTHKGDIYTESKAAVAGGTTSFMEMPNTKPQAVTIDILEEKYKAASLKSFANYSFYLGATNGNINELLKVDPSRVCGVKVFMGSSTGNMLVDNRETLEKIFSGVKTLIATHCEDEDTIQKNTAKAKEIFGDDVPIEQHPIIRNAEACYRSSSFAVELAKKHGARLHILHLSTEKEMSLFDNSLPLKEKKITGEACVHHLIFNESHYKERGAFVKWNPAVKSETDRKAVLKALLDDKIDVVATDHAPHTIDEKKGGALKAMSGGPMVQHSLIAMLEFVQQGVMSYTKVVEKMCHAPADLFRIKNRGYIKQGYAADIVLVDPESTTEVKKDNILYKCGWSPLEGMAFKHSIVSTFVNGNRVFHEGSVNETYKGQRLEFLL